MLSMRKYLLFTVACGVALNHYSFAKDRSSEGYSYDKSVYSSRGIVQNTIQGVVSDNNGPLAGVTIQVVGTSTIAVTDAQGRYSINAPQGSTLRFSSVGYVTQDIRVGANQTLNVVLIRSEERRVGKECGWRWARYE